MALSVLAELVRENAFDKFDTAEPEARDSVLEPAMEGFTRGSLGSTGAEFFEHRNPDAQEDEERETLQSPIMEAFLNRTTRRF